MTAGSAVPGTLGMPDTISSDLHAASINSPSYPTLPWVMSKFLALGLPLDEVVAKTTVKRGVTILCHCCPVKS